MIVRTALLTCLALSSTVANAEMFAISCTGTSTWEDTVTGQKIGKTNTLPEQIYIIDTDANKVRHVLKAMQEIEDTCSVIERDCHVDISQGLIKVWGSQPDGDTDTSVALDIDRADGKATYDLKLAYPDGRYHDARWDMVCQKTAIPIFDKSKNKF